MKQLLRLTLLAGLLIFGCSSTTFAQKFGYIDTNEVISEMPEMDSVRIKLEALNKDLQDTFESMQVEFNNKVNDYTKNMETLSDAVRKVKEDEIQNLSMRLEQFQETAPESMQEEQMKLMRPVIEKARGAIDKVGKASSLTAVFDLASSALAYHDKTTMTDITSMVKTELGIK